MDSILDNYLKLYFSGELGRTFLLSMPTTWQDTLHEQVTMWIGLLEGISLQLLGTIHIENKDSDSAYQENRVFTIPLSSFSNFAFCKIFL